MIKKYIFTLLAVCAVVLLLLILSNRERNFTKEDVSSSSYTPSAELSNEEYLRIEKEMLALVREQDPRVAMAEMRKAVNGNPALTRSCHGIVHDIGHAAYEKYKDFGEAMQYQDEFCNSGYLHGIIEIHFSKSEDVFKDIQAVCDPYPMGSFKSFGCFHGIGHGLMYYTVNDLPKSLALCEELQNGFAKSNCADGVFMENFNTDQKDHISKYLDPKNPSKICEDQSAKWKNACYVYAPIYYLSLHKNDYEKALSWCGTVEDGYQDACAEGVGSQAIKENIENPLLVEKVCLTGNINQLHSCIYGLVGLYINHFASFEEAKKLCPRLQFLNRQTCIETIDLRPPFVN